jgi:hypothetical protein
MMRGAHWIAGAALALATSVAGTSVAMAQRSSGRPPWAGDLIAAQLVEVRDKTGQVLLHGALTTTKDTAKETERKADLANPAGQAGKGEIEISIERKDGGMTANEIDLDVEKLPALLGCEVFLDGRWIGALVTSKNGKGKLDLDWKAPRDR